MSFDFNESIRLDNELRENAKRSASNALNMKRWRERYLASWRRVLDLEIEQNAFQFLDQQNEHARRIVDELEIEIIAERAELVRLRAAIEIEPKILSPVVWPPNNEKVA
jgi:hypothetical protein